jgi:cytochrome c peroxidase
MAIHLLAPSLRHAIAFLAVILLSVALAACEGHADLADLNAQQLTAVMVPASPTNSYADNAAAAALGQRLFFDKHLSVDATIACASCHSPDHGFSDPRPFSVGVGGQLGGRHAMPVTTVAFQTFTLWDGRADSVWMQPLKAIENPKEMDLTRLELARLMHTSYRGEYEAIFGALPSLDQTPARGKPGMVDWDALPEPVRDDIDEVAANVGKALEAYERKLICADTHFDRWVRGEEALTAREQNGARSFVAHRCNTCHSGPAFSDGKFHNIGVPSSDPGRSVGRDQLLADIYNGAGLFSDDAVAGQLKLASAATETNTEGAFKTPSLRGAGQRTFFGHASHQETLRGFIADIYRGGRGRRDATIGSLDPLLQGVNVPGDELDDIVAFLHALDCPAAATEIVAP